MNEVKLSFGKDKVGFSKKITTEKPEALMKDDEQIKRLKELNLPIPHHLLYIVGRSGSGKTTMIQKLLNDRGKNKKYKNVFHKIHFFSPSTNTLGSDLKIPEEQIHDDLSEIETITNDLDPEEFNLFIIDDLIFDLNESNFLRKLLTRYRHKGLSIWICSQAYNGLFRKARLNDPILVLYPMSKDQLLDVHKDRYGKDMDEEIFSQIAKSIWNSGIENERPFLMIDRNNKIHRNFTPVTYEIN
jgi:Cdc6-like AAA superfamily ATPase